MAQISAGQDGIQKLLAAEKEAQEIVAKARKGAGLCVARTLIPLHHRTVWYLSGPQQLVGRAILRSQE